MLANPEKLIHSHVPASIIAMPRHFLVIDPETQPEVLHGLASPTRVRILKLLQGGVGVNVNDIADALGQPQSTVSSNLQILEKAGLIRTETQKGRKGNQKLCFSTCEEVLVMLRDEAADAAADMIDVAMPIGLYTSCEVSAPCGLCSPQGIIGLLDVPDAFLNPDRMNAGLMWFTRGFVEYQFPNNARLVGKEVDGARLFDGAVVGSARHLDRLAVRHHSRDQRPGSWNLDEPRRLWRQARRLYS